jgi:Protein of unknown function (DUF3098)
MSKEEQKDEINQDFAFGKQNYILLLAGTLLAVLGYVLMTGGGSDDPAVFSEDLFSFRRMYIAPILILAGLGVVLWGIMKKVKD